MPNDEGEESKDGAGRRIVKDDVAERHDHALGRHAACCNGRRWRETDPFRAPAAIEEFVMTMFVKITRQTRSPELLRGLIASISDFELQGNRKGRKVSLAVAPLLRIDHG